VHFSIEFSARNIIRRRSVGHDTNPPGAGASTMPPSRTHIPRANRSIAKGFSFVARLQKASVLSLDRRLQFCVDNSGMDRLGQ
jgi:hypothetical protein